MSDVVQLVREPIHPDLQRGAAPGDGAVCVFAGVVRDENEGRTVLRLEYEAYEEMALPLMLEIAAEAHRLHAISSVRMEHRLGTLAVGELSVIVAVASPHRAAAFAACRFVIDALKSRVPIWKKEHYADGSAWLGKRATPGGA
jgi:molybdopterin synthase catalytic subunit